MTDGPFGFASAGLTGTGDVVTEFTATRTVDGTERHVTIVAGDRSPEAQRVGFDIYDTTADRFFAGPLRGVFPCLGGFTVDFGPLADLETVAERELDEARARAGGDRSATFTVVEIAEMLDRVVEAGRRAVDAMAMRLEADINEEANDVR